MIAPRPDRKGDERTTKRLILKLTDHGAVAESDLLPGEVVSNEILVGSPIMVREDVSISWTSVTKGRREREGQTNDGKDG